MLRRISLCISLLWLAACAPSSTDLQQPQGIASPDAAGTTRWDHSKLRSNCHRYHRRHGGSVWSSRLAAATAWATARFQSGRSTPNQESPLTTTRCRPVGVRPPRSHAGG